MLDTMAKKIKFNLLLDGNPVRDLEGVRNNFNIHELLAYLEDGVLERWLVSRGYYELWERIQMINRNDLHQLITDLTDVFGMEITDSGLKEVKYSLEQMRYREMLIQQIKEGEFQLAKIIEQYHQEFYMILQQIEERKDDFPFIKTKISLISDHYHELVKINIIRFYQYFIDQAPLVIFTALMDHRLRSYFLNDSTISELLNQIVKPEYLQSLPFKLMWSNASHEQRYWRVIGRENEEYIIIRMEDGNYVRNLEKFDEALTHEEVNGKFPILKGIEYQSAFPEDKIIFLPSSARNVFWIKDYKKMDTIPAY